MLNTSALLFAGLAAADRQFRSRPDLAPPRLNITIPAASSAVEPCYLSVAPFASVPDTTAAQHGPRQAGSYIPRDDGDLVWSGFEGDHNAGYGNGHGHITILDQHYETIRELRAGNHKLVDKHEFHVVNEETGLIQIYQPVPRDLTPSGAKPEQQWIVNATIQGRVCFATRRSLISPPAKSFFEWSSLDHVSPDEAILPINPGQAGSGYNSSDAWDYFHTNSVDKDPAGNYLISARDACAVHKINGTDGSTIWRLGGTKSSFVLGDGVDFCFQHHARWLSQDADGDEEVISLYDNSAHGTERDDGGEVHTAPTSSGEIIRVSARDRTAEIVRGFYPPDGLRSKSQGSRQVLPGAADGAPVFHAYMDLGALGVGVENYRAFRFNWRGLPQRSRRELLGVAHSPGC